MYKCVDNNKLNTIERWFKKKVKPADHVIKSGAGTNCLIRQLKPNTLLMSDLIIDHWHTTSHWGFAAGFL